MVNAISDLWGEQVIEEGVSFEDFITRYDGQWVEWINGAVIAISPINQQHENIRDYLRDMFRAYFALNPIGVITGEPQTMRLPTIASGRSPDLFIVLNENQQRFHKTYMDGPANIVIEIASPTTAAIDRGKKFVEYEQGGVQEYWVIDGSRKDAQFYRLNDEGVYLAYSEDADGFYESPQLARLTLHVPTLWEDELPNILQIVQSVRAMWEAK